MRYSSVRLFSCVKRFFHQRKYSTFLNEDVKSIPHCPVMASETVCYLKPSDGDLVIDMTFGAGGHTKHLLEFCPSLRIIALDRDPVAFSYAQKLADLYPNQITPLLGKFSELPALLAKLNIKQNSVDGILFDFGCSSMQFDVAERGFSLSKDGPLDMRMDGDRFPNTPTASDVLAMSDEEDLIKIFKVYGEEKLAKKIARGIVEARYTFKTFRSTRELADFISGICDKDYRLDKMQRNAHIATKVFQALRIFVNNELNEINYAMIVAQRYLKVGGRMVTICFHSLEDTIVKRHIAGHTVDNSVSKLPQKYINYAKSHDLEAVEEVLASPWSMIHRHVITPTEDEVIINPRSRSAKLRAAVKLR
ncbi:probable methyltransferase-like protein 15 homolog [Homalodisca vitripennis]|nr:probable methyltransferase-like protein 15 homolog [Homalodisca vitripennis]XP_046686936.1 probable methyltransferase-like protein 15 homolog [Homalodisca vitripennis]KAG8257577.1 putative methyltransferase-like protein 15 [Homalodisca vitripennis]